MNKILTGLVSLLTLCQVGVLQAQTPRLVVMVSVEELRADLLEELAREMPDDGINRLLNRGKVYGNVAIPLLRSNTTAAEAILHTGTLATSNGVAERKPMRTDRAGKRIHTNSVFEDKDFLGYATSGNYSPHSLSAPTIGDNLKKATQNKALVYSIAPKAEEAIISSGLYGNGAYWIDPYTGRWASSTYYQGDFPIIVDRSNVGNESLPTRLGNGIGWRNSSKTHLLKAYTGGASFDHSFGKTTSDIEDFTESPLINDEVVRLAKSLLSGTGLGKDEITDLLSLHLTVANGNKAESDVTSETIDSYLRLDRSIAELLKHIDLNNTLVVLTGNGISREYAPAVIDDRRLFKADRCLALVNMYLHAEFGVQGLVEEITPYGAVYLNRTTIKSNPKVKLREVQSAVSDLLLEFSGIAYAIEEYRLRESAISNNDNSVWLTALNSAINANRPDIVFGLLPSWVAQDLSSPRQVQSYQMVATPTLFVMMHPSIKANKIETPLDLREVSTKIAWTLRIRPPTP